MDAFTFDLILLTCLFLGGVDSLVRSGWAKLKSLVLFTPPTWLKLLLRVPQLMWRGFVILTVIMVVSMAWIGFAS